jgi:hypothetical protein
LGLSSRATHRRHLLGRRDLEGRPLATSTLPLIRRPLTIQEFRAVVALCARPEGATAKELQAVMRNRRYYDSVGQLRKYLQRYSAFVLFARRMSPEDRQRHGYIGAGKIYRVRLREDAA